MANITITAQSSPVSLSKIGCRLSAQVKRNNVFVGATQGVVNSSGVINWSYLDANPSVGENIYEFIPQEDGCIAPCKIPATSSVVYNAVHAITSNVVIGQNLSWTITNGKPNSTVYVREERYINNAWSFSFDYALPINAAGSYNFTATVPVNFFTGTRRFRQINPEETLLCPVQQEIIGVAPNPTSAPGAPPPAAGACIRASICIPQAAGSTVSQNIELVGAAVGLPLTVEESTDNEVTWNIISLFSRLTNASPDIVFGNFGTTCPAYTTAPSGVITDPYTRKYRVKVSGAVVQSCGGAGTAPPPSSPSCIGIIQASPVNPLLLCGATNLTLNSTEAIGQFTSASGITVNTAPAGIVFAWDPVGYIIPSGTGSGNFSISISPSVVSCAPCVISGTININSPGRWRITGDAAQPTALIEIYNAQPGATVQIVQVSNGAIIQTSVVQANGTIHAIYTPAGFTATSSTIFTAQGTQYRATVNGVVITS